MSFRTWVTENPRGMKYSYMATLSGIGEMFSDGLASWASFDATRTERAGCLVTRDYRLIFLSDPQKPLTVGSDVNIELLDDGTDEVFELFAPGYEGVSVHVTMQNSTYSTPGVTAIPGGASNTAIWVDTARSSELVVDEYYHLGSLETVKLTAIGGTFDRAVALTVERAKFGTLAREHKISDGTYGLKMTSSPTTFKGRYLEIFMAPVDSLTGLLDTAYAVPIWVGIVAEIKEDDGRIQVQATPLSGILESAWPAVLPKGRLGGDMLAKFMSVHAWNAGIDFHYPSTDTLWGFERAQLAPGYYDTDGTTFVLVTPAAGHYSMYFLIKVIQDTLLEFFATTTILPFWVDPDRPYENKLKLALRETEPEKFKLFSSFMPDASVTPSMYNHFVRAFQSAWANDPSSGISFDIKLGDSVLAASWNGTAVLDKHDMHVLARCDSPIYTFGPTWNARLDVTGNNTVRNLGLLRIQDGDKWELCEIMSATPQSDDPRMFELFVNRGVGGTEAQDWGKDEDNPHGKPGTPGAAVVQMLYMADDFFDQENEGADPPEKAHMDPDLVVNALLMSFEATESADRQVDGTYDSSGNLEALDRLYGYRTGLGIPKRYVDHEGITSAFKRNAAEPLTAFWVDEAGKGKVALEEFMKYHGMFFVTKRFMRDDVAYFGLSVDSISQPVGTYYSDTVTDSDRVMGTKVPIDLNERLVVNIVSFSPYYTGWGGSKPDGDQLFYYDEWSIEEYGASKALDLKPTILDWYMTEPNNYGLDGRTTQYALGLVAAYRWFSAFGNGNFTISVECPAPTGWRYQNGDHVLISLTGPRDPSTGHKNLADIPARIIRCEQLHGARAGAKLELRCSYNRRCELAPNARVTVIAASTITVDANYFSTSEQRNPFNADEGATDADWFDPTIHDADIPIRIWTEGQYGTTLETTTITGRAGNVLTISDNLTALDVATNLTGGARTIISFDTWPTDASTYLIQKYAYIANTEEELGSGDASESRAKEFA